MALLGHVADVRDLELAWVAPGERLQVQGEFVHAMATIAYCLAHGAQLMGEGVHAGEAAELRWPLSG
jgi:hypothetical protein